MKKHCATGVLFSFLLLFQCFAF